MGNDRAKRPSEAGGELHHRAERKLMEKPHDAGFSRSDHETQRLLHELQIHQIELEMQNAELRQTRDELEMVLDRYSDLYDFAPVGYFILDSKGVIGAVNLSGASLLGIERSVLVGRPFGLFVEEKAVFCDFLSTVFASQGKETCEVTLKAGNRTLFVRIEATVAEAGELCRVAVIDITELKLSEERNIQLKNELEQRVSERTLQLECSNEALHASYHELETSYKALEVFSYAVAHDLRTPLRSMCGFSKILLEDYSDKLDQTGKKWLARIGGAAERMGQLVDGILDLSRITRTKLSRENVNLSSLALDIVKVLSELEPEHNVNIVISEEINVHGDLHLLKQVLENLLDNAWKYSRKEVSPKIEFGTSLIDEETVYFVRDNGIGFDMNHAARLFIPFERLHGLDEFEGIGIGLATVQRIISRHEGRIWAEGVPGRGATFHFTLQARTAESLPEG